jgi:predicted 3-demethylubiquinone-9 3-methyltransferase (glyoxalase superfamily)
MLRGRLKYYPSVFKNSRRVTDLRNPADGSILTSGFELDGQTFTALNGGPRYKLTEAIFFVVPGETQEEIDGYWSELTAGGEESRCGG